MDISQDEVVVLNPIMHKSPSAEIKVDDTLIKEGADDPFVE
jgi:hypothetical protein